MNDAQQDSSPQQATPELSGIQAGVKWVGKHWPRVRLGHEALMLDRMERIQRFTEVLARNTMTGKMDDTTGLLIGTEGSEMGVTIGDRVVNHYYPQPDPPSRPEQTPAEEKPKQASPLAKLALGAIGAVLLGTGIGWGISRLAAPVAAGIIDTDTTLEVEAVQLYQPPDVE